MLLGEAFRAGVRAVRRSKRLLLCASLTTALAGLPLAVFVARQVDAQGARRPDAVDVARVLDPDFFADVRSANPAFDADVTALVVVSLVLMFAVRPLLWGGYAGIASTRKRFSFARFVREGGALYWKYLRISALGLLLLGAAAVALKPVLETVDRFAEGEASEVAARNARLLGQGLAFGALCFVAMILDYARIGLRMRRRPGVLAELGRSALFVLQHPFRTTGFYFVVLVLEVALCAPLILLIRAADGGYVATSVVVLVLGQGMIALREGLRLFHLAGAWTLREAEERVAPARNDRAGASEEDLLEEPLPWHVG